MSRQKLFIVCALCFVAVAGCRTAPSERPTLDTEDPPDQNVRPPAGYEPADPDKPWPLGPEPQYGTAEWREWLSMRNGSRAVVPFIAVPPEIDGRLDDAAWQNASSERFLDATNAPADPGTELFLAYDEDNLYVAARLAEPEPDKIRAEIRRLCREMGRGGGYILGLAKAFQPETPTLNAVAAIEEFLGQAGIAMPRRAVS